MGKLMGSTSGDDTRVGEVRGWSDLYAIDGYEKVKPTARCMIIATSNKQDLESDCKTLIRCCSNIPDDALMDRVSVTLLEFVVQLVLSRIKSEGAVHLQFPGALHEAHVYWLFSYLQTILWFHPLLETGFQFCSAGQATLYVYSAAPFQWEIAWQPTTLTYLIPYGIFWSELFAIGNIWDCLQYEYLQLWRPPDVVISLAWIGSVIKILGAPNLDNGNQLECVCYFLGTYDQGVLHYCIGAVGAQLQWGFPDTACLPFHESYLHGMGEHLPSTLLIGFCCQSSQEDCDSSYVVTKGQVLHWPADNYSEGFHVVIYITRTVLDMIIGWEGRTVGCSTWMKGSVPTQLLVVYSMLNRLTSNTHKATCY
jgi:hypothetical protein